MAKYRIATCTVPVPDPAGEDAAIVVIDTLRASSTVITALSLGIQTIIPVIDDQQAFSLKKGGSCLTSGEAGGVKIQGYDIGNSPVELIKAYRQSPFSTLALKTSNFIPLIKPLPSAIVCSTLNLTAVARYLEGRSALILAAGGKRGIAEDLGTALALGGLLSGIELDPAAIKSFVKESQAARHLCSIGYEQDVEFIARVNVFDIVAVYDGSVIQKAA